MISVVIADDQALVRAGFRSIVDSADDLVVVAEAAEGGQAVEQVREHRPDVVLMDIRMPGLDGIEATRLVVGDPRLDQTRVIIVTTFDLDEYIFEALRAGASGFLLKDTEPGDLIESIRIIHRGDALLSPSVTRRLVSAFVTRTRDVGPIPDLHRLTAREREVMATGPNWWSSPTRAVWWLPTRRTTPHAEPGQVYLVAPPVAQATSRLRKVSVEKRKKTPA